MTTQNATPVRIIKIKRNSITPKRKFSEPQILPGCVSRRLVPGPACGPLPGTAYEKMVKSR